MKIYHGSTEIVQHPTILDSQRLLDFGKGFYTTTSVEQAEKWAFLYKTLSLFETGILTKQETIIRLKVHQLFDQLSFHNMELLKEIKYFHSYEVIP
ncbi:MAG: DUF3990 domain-containing protein [Bacteroidia bacterium]|nr:DUF3990 domain-containing protein [Bacteroidia bacterium]